MGKIEDFLNTQEPSGVEKISGFYGCKYCNENMDHAFWDESKMVLFWICPEKHRTEQNLV